MPRPVPVELMESVLPALVSRKGLPSYLELVDVVRNLRKGPIPGDMNWRSECFAPMAVANAWSLSEGVRMDLLVQSLVTALAAWRVTQGIYRFDRTLLDQLLETPLFGTFPADCLLRLPEWCVYVETPGLFEDAEAGFFAYIDEPHDTVLQLVFVGRRESQCSCHMAASFRIDGALMWDCTNIPPERALELERIARGGVSVLAYLCSEDAEVRPTRGRGKITPVAKPRKNGAPRMPQAKALEVWETGFRLGAQLREAVAREKEGNGGTVRPHVRRAHWHTYLRGKGRSERVLKWTHPILVVGGPDRATIRNVNDHAYCRETPHA